MRDMRYFNTVDFECPDCKRAKMDDDFLFMLDFLRFQVGKPMWINSGYRCDKHEAAVGGSGANHPEGKAVDIRSSRVGLYRIVKYSPAVGFTGMGMKLQGPLKSRYIHLDTTHKIFTPWTYK